MRGDSRTSGGAWSSASIRHNEGSRALTRLRIVVSRTAIIDIIRYVFIHLLLMRVASSSTIQGECSELRLRVRRAALTQQAIADALGISQGQVSRVLSGHLARPSRVFREISIYVASASTPARGRAALDQPAISDALAHTWDGTEAHAQALAAVIRSLALLDTPPRRSRR